MCTASCAPPTALLQACRSAHAELHHHLCHILKRMPDLCMPAAMLEEHLEMSKKHTLHIYTHTSAMNTLVQPTCRQHIPHQRIAHGWLWPPYSDTLVAADHVHSPSPSSSIGRPHTTTLGSTMAAPDVYKLVNTCKGLGSRRHCQRLHHHLCTCTHSCWAHACESRLQPTHMPLHPTLRLVANDSWAEVCIECLLKHGLMYTHQ